MQIYKNKLSKELSNELYFFGLSYILGDDKLSQYGYPNKVMTKTNYSWNERIIQESKPVLIYVIPGEITSKICKEFKDLGILSGNEYNIGSMIYVWTEGSYIPKHTDKDEKNTNRIACTAYLNPEWDLSKGGTFHYQETESKEWKMIIPEQGTIVFNDKLEAHYTTPVIGKTFRISLQFFAVDDK